MLLKKLQRYILADHEHCKFITNFTINFHNKYIHFYAIQRGNKGLFPGIYIISYSNEVHKIQIKKELRDRLEKYVMNESRLRGYGKIKYILC